MSGYVKFFSSILDSSIWDTPPAITKVWCTLMAMADRNGIVEASLPGLAHRSRVDIETVQEALALFMGPDKYSKTPDFEGRRVVTTEGGWFLINYAKHRELMSKDDIREKATARQRKWRADHAVTPCHVNDVTVTPGDASNDIASASASAASPADQLELNGSVHPIGSGGEAAPPPLRPPIDKVLLTYPCVGRAKTWELTTSKVKRWRELFPDLDLGKECRAALAHVEATPSKRKTANGMERFLVAWFSRSQNGGGGRGTSPPATRGEKTQNHVGDWLSKKGKK